MGIFPEKGGFAVRLNLLHKPRDTVQELLGILETGPLGLRTGQGELVFFRMEPTNLSVQSPEAVGSRIYALMTVLRSMEELEFLALNARESFEDNQRYYHQRIREESNPAIRSLLEQDAGDLDRLQLRTATARDFYLVVRLRKERAEESRPYLSRIQKALEDQGFKVRLADREDCKRMLGVYLEQNTAAERYADFDGEEYL